MTRILGTILIAGAVLVMIGGVILFFFQRSQQSPPVANTASTTLPVAGATSSTTTSIGSLGNTQMVVAARGTNAPIVVNKFLDNGVTVEDTENPGTYFLAGSVGYCLKDGTCPAGAPADNYIVTYDSANQFFTIALTQEPLGDARLQAERFLLTTLGVSQKDLCALKYYLGTTSYVNQFYAGKNLGFSFCEGATQLP